MSAFTSCSDDPDTSGTIEPEPTLPGSTLTEKTYTSADNLALTLNGNPIIGKTVTFTPTEDGTATVTLAGEPLDFNQILGMLTKAENEDEGIKIPTAGVLPGSASLTIPVKLEGDNDNCTFSGAGETDYVTYSYTGAATEDSFSFELKDVKLKNTSMVGTYTTADFLKDPEDMNSGNLLNICRIKWESTNLSEMEFMGMPIPMPIRDVLVMALALPVFNPDENGNPTTPILEMLHRSLKSVTFTESGDLIAKYVDAETGVEAESPVGYVQYVVDNSNTIRVFINPGAIIANTVENTKADVTRSTDLPTAINNLMTELVPLFTQGIPVKYGPAIISEDNKTDENMLCLYLDTDTLLPLLKAVAPLLADETFSQGIMDQIASDPSMASMASSLQGILKTLPDVVAGTTAIEIGINFKK